MLPTLLHRLFRSQRPALTGQAAIHVSICPPPVAAEGFGAGLKRWLRVAAFLDGKPAPTSRAERRASTDLATVKRDFVEATVGVPSWKSADLRHRIGRAQSLRELWHLRIDVFTFVSLHLDQTEADDRLAWINRHFPTRSPRSGFGELNMREFK